MEPSVGGARTADLPDECLHRLVEAQVERSPDADAVVLGDERLSYQELDRRVDHLAQELCRRGAAPEAVVGVYLDCPLAMVIGVLGVLKAGGAFLPLDPEHPDERSGHILADSGARLVLTQPHLTGRVRRLCSSGVDAICVDTTGGGSVAQKARVPAAVRPGNLAYVIYTSGTTGLPKGVAVEHRSVTRYLRSAFSTYAPVDSSSVVLQLASLTFDPWLRDAIGPLTRGATVVLLPQHDRRDPERVLTAIRRHRVNALLGLVPSMLSSLVEATSFESHPVRLTTTLVSGESFLPLKRHGDRLRQFGRLVNHYGPTECTLIAAAHEVTPRDPPGCDIIGRPIQDVRIHVLDRSLHPVPVGVPGEIHIGGPKLARGYFQRAGATAERFIPDPFAGGGGRLYRTGDLGRYLADGSIEFLGRIDRQIKLRGYRIEPGEVEAALATHPAVKQAVVVLSEGEADTVALVAYFVAADHGGPSPGDLQAYLRQRLPPYMVPAIFVRLDALPTGPTGKIDVDALPPPPALRPGLGDGPVPPRTPTEALIASIWANVLGVETVGRHDDFFALGGHSIRATQVGARLQRLLGANVTVEDVFRHPTVAKLATVVASTGRNVDPIGRRDRGGQVPLSPAQGRAFAQQRLYRLDPVELGSGEYLFQIAFRLTGALGPGALERALTELTRRHEMLRTTFAGGGGGPVQVVLPAMPFYLTLEELTRVPEPERERAVAGAAAAEANRPFDLATGPLLRARLLRLGASDHVLLFTFHHLVLDGWSVGVFLRELSALYNAFRGGRSSPLAELPIQYADYALWEREHLTGDLLDRHLDYWRAQLRDVAVLELPTDRPRPPARQRRGARCPLTVAAQLVRALHAVGRDRGVTLFMTLLAAFDVLLARCAGQTDIAVGTPIANRTRQEVEGLIGLFTNTLVMRTDLSGDPSFLELLERVRATTLAGYAHQAVPFERLVEEIAPRWDPRRTPLYQVMFVLQNAPMELPVLEGLTVRPFDVPNDAAKYELLLSLTEGPGGLGGFIEYQSALFDPETVGRFAGRFIMLLEAVAADPGRRLSQLTVLRGVRVEG